MSPDEVAFLTQGPFRRLEELRRLLDGSGIQSEIVLPPGGDPGK